jgi:hypothetical protein
MTPALFIEIGEALYGPRWHSEMAREIGVSRMTIHRWATGQWPVAEFDGHKIHALIINRSMVCASIISRLDNTSPTQ